MKWTPKFRQQFKWDIAMQKLYTSTVSTENLEQEFDVQQTHSIERWDRNKLLLQSEGRGWSNLYVAVATVNSWSGTLNPTGHYCIGFCLRGPAQLRVRVAASSVAQHATLSPRQFLIIPADESSQWTRRGSSEMLMLYLKKELVEAVSRHVFGRPHVKVAIRLGATDPLLEQLALAVLESLQHSAPATTPAFVDTLAWTLATQLLKAHSINTEKNQAISPCYENFRSSMARVQDFIDRSLGEDLSLEVIASQANMSVCGLKRLFQKHHATSPHQYLLERRIAKASRILVETELPISEVALTTGFSSQSHFATAFKKKVGLSPKAYRHEKGVPGQGSATSFNVQLTLA
jgi:AraC family transcriptional regulator